MKPLVYLQNGFWEKLSEDLSREGIRSMIEVSDAIEDSVVITDASEETILRDKFLMVLIKQKKYQRCDENYISKQIDALKTTNNTENLCATYLLDKNTSACDDIEKKFGVIVLNVSNINNRRFIFKGDGFSLDKKIRYGSRYLTFKEKLSHPCNSMIIIDPYLLIDRETDTESGNVKYPGIENNLESLLDAMLPSQLSVDFHLTIISCLKEKDEIKKVYEKVKKCLRRIRRDLPVKLNLVYTSTGYSRRVESFHSRHVLSNTFAIDSEDGLDLFSSDGHLTKNNPSVSVVFPRMFGDNRQDMTKYYNWIASVKKYLNEFPQFVYGNYDEGNNRLFDLTV